MAHFAKIRKGNIVEKVVVVHNNVATTEQTGVDFLNNLYKSRDVWKQTSYNGNIERTSLEKVILTIKLETHLFHLNLLTVGY